MKWFAAAFAFASLYPGNLHAREPWVMLNDCRYLANEANDGDSFHVRCGDKQRIFRLYFVDAPKTDEGLGDRVDEQAKYFGVTVPQVMQIREAAKEFVKKSSRGRSLCGHACRTHWVAAKKNASTRLWK